MFTGLIQKIATVESINSHHGDLQVLFQLDSDFISSVSEGDSISINGVCLTAYNIDYEKNCFSVDISNETLDITTLTQMSTGYKVNIESALNIGDKLGGHIVSGHVDCMAQVSEIKEDARSYRLGFELNNERYAKYIVAKGSICVDGISLTVNKDENSAFFVNIIPFTWDNTIMQYYKVGDMVNIEVDRMALHIEKLILSKD
jgi:riboflavin synthase